MPARLNRDTTGPIARTVTDAALLFQAMVAYDPADNLTSLALQARQGAVFHQAAHVRHRSDTLSRVP